jgi:hypothetical protein
VERRDVAAGAATEDGDVVRRHVLDTNGVRGLLLSLLVVIGLSVGTPAALAVSCARERAADLQRRGDVAATGVVSSIAPGGFIFAADRVYKGELPEHVLVLGQYRPPDLGTTFFAVMRFHLPGVYSMDVCDGRLLADANLGLASVAHAPSPDLPIAQAAVGVVLVLLALLLILRRGRGKPAAPAAAAAY